MKPIPQEYIDAIPTSVEATRESCQEAADLVLHVLFLMGADAEPKLAWPPILSGDVELWPMPAPHEPGERRTVPLLVELNGGGEGGYLVACRRNAEEFNKALDESKPEVAKEIASLGPQDSAHLWNSLNSLACSVEDEAIYRPLELSDECERAYHQAVGT